MGVSFFPPFVQGEFKQRINRFVALCEVDGCLERAHLPNPGRLRELLLPGRMVYLAPRLAAEGETRYKVLAVERGGYPVVLDTLAANRVADWLLRRQVIPAFRGYNIVRAEVKMGDSRFDFLLEKEGQELYLEVKSCTLYQGRVAMFPDAITERGRRHLQELAELSRQGKQCAVLFIVHAPAAEYFLPDYHTDLKFANTLAAVRDEVLIQAVRVQWDRELRLLPQTDLLPVPWAVLEREAADGGAYIVVLRLKEAARITVGSLGEIDFAAGYYVYVGSARQGMERRLARHRRLRKQLHWHIDYLRARAEWVDAYPVRTRDDLECLLAKKIAALADREVPRFGCSDCRCRTHLFGFHTQPDRTWPFVQLLLEMRMARLQEMIIQQD